MNKFYDSVINKMHKATAGFTVINDNGFIFTHINCQQTVSSNKTLQMRKNSNISHRKNMNDLH